MSQETAVPSANTHQVRAAEFRPLDGRDATQSPVARLAQFFPNASPVRIPVEVVAGELGAVALSEQTVIQFGTPDEVLFLSSLPLEFGDRLRLKNADRSLDVAVFVVAVQYYAGHTAVAARFMQAVKNWIVKG